MSLTKVLNYDTAGNFTFDTSVIEVTTEAKLKNQINVDETLFNEFTTKDLFRNVGGSPTGNLVGVAVISGNRMSIPNGTGSWNMDPTGMQGTDARIMAVRFKLIPLYSGVPPLQQNIFKEQQTISSNKNSIHLFHSAVGTLNAILRTDTGAPMGTWALGAWSPVASQVYEFELNIDVISGAQRLFIDGVQHGPTATDTYARDLATTTYTAFGDNANGNFQIDDFQRFTTIQHTANFASEVPRVVARTTYVTTDPSIIENGLVEVDGLDSFTETSTVPAGAVINHILNIDSIDMYFDGAAWVASDGSLAQSNPVADINTNLALLDVSAGVNLKVKSLLSSTAGTVTPELTVMTIGYCFFASVVPLVKCVVYGYIYDGCNPVDGATITFLSRDLTDDTANFTSINEVAVTDSNGYFEITLPSTLRAGQDSIKVDTSILFTDSKGEEVERDYTIVVPASATSSLEDTII